MSNLRQIRRALISVSDKTGLTPFASELTKFGIRLISTGGTARALREAGLEVTDVSDITGFPEMMDGRVKTLHPKIHGAFLALRDDQDHVAAMRQHDIEPIDLVVVNLYPFEATIAKEGVALDDAVENIDIGGPAMIRSASKNWRDVAIVTDPAKYDEIIAEMRGSNGSLCLTTRQKLAAAAFVRTAAYDIAISSYLEKQLSTDAAARQFPEVGHIRITKLHDLRYGENPHQKAALYVSGEGGIANARQLNGKEMSYNNYVDAEAAWHLVQDLDERAVAIIKHTNPSGVGTGDTNEEAYRRALSTDPVSAFGGIVAFNRKVDEQEAASVIEVFTEVVAAPEYTGAALERLRSKTNLRVLEVTVGGVTDEIEFRQISGGFLAQQKDAAGIAATDLRIVTERRPNEDETAAMLLAWRVCKHVKSNAIVLADACRTLGIGAGQMNRVDSVRIAAARAERFALPLKGAALASDAFFPFRDNVEEAAKYGISSIIQPGGSVRDDEVIAAANEHKIAMAFTAIRHFKH
jgi:phosphoribosylaminoimidazolecarboxamide formyltransferase/IMP cyclohydrolase